VTFKELRKIIAEKEMEIEAKYYDPSMDSLIHYIPPISKKCYLVSDRRRLCFGLF
jgi:hypothetical protein